jgi:hypothetical protein
MNVMPSLAGEINDANKTPIEVAKQTGHEHVAEIIEHLADHNGDDTGDAEDQFF